MNDYNNRRYKYAYTDANICNIAYQNKSVSCHREAVNVQYLAVYFIFTYTV